MVMLTGNNSAFKLLSSKVFFNFLITHSLMRHYYYICLTFRFFIDWHSAARFSIHYRTGYWQEFFHDLYIGVSWNRNIATAFNYQLCIAVIFRVYFFDGFLEKFLL